MSPLTPEQKARQAIDAALFAAGWQVQDEEDVHLGAGPGVAVREFRMASGHGRADYLLFVDGRPVGAGLSTLCARMLASRAELSLQSLQKIMDALHAAVVIQPEETVRSQLSPHDASRALAAAMAA